MNRRMSASVSLMAFTLLLALPVVAAETAGKVSGKFVLAGVDAQLKNVRAKRVKLDDKTGWGYAAVISERPAKGDVLSWQTAEPKERGNFVFVIFEKNGAIWTATLGHVKSKSNGSFGTITDVKKAAFEVRDKRLIAHIKTDGERFFDDPYTVDLTFEATLEEP